MRFRRGPVGDGRKDRGRWSVLLAESGRGSSSSGCPLRSHAACGGVKQEGGFRGIVLPPSRKRKKENPQPQSFQRLQPLKLVRFQSNRMNNYQFTPCRTVEKQLKPLKFGRGGLVPLPVETCRKCRKNTYKNRQNCGLSGFSCKGGKLKCNKM